MKVLHVAMGMSEFDRAWQATGHEVIRFDWRAHEGKRPSAQSAAYIRAKVLTLAEAHRPDLVFMQLQTPGIMDADTVLRVRDIGCVVMNWTGDVRENIEWYKALGHAFNVTLFTNGTDIEIMRGIGLPADYLQIGYDPLIYNNDRKKRGSRHGIVFLGNDYRNMFPESESRREMVAAMRQAFGHTFEAYGRGWGTMPLVGPAEVKAYHVALIAINWDHFHRPLFASDRILRAQACGCVVVSRHYPGIYEEHPLAKAANDAADAVRICRVLLNDPVYATNVGAYAADHTLVNHTWEARIPRIIDLYNTYR